MRYVALQYGIPCSIVTEQGTQFMGDVLTRLYKLLKVHKIKGTRTDLTAMVLWRGHIRR